MNYVLDEKGNRVEGLSKEEMLAVLQQAIDDGSLAGIEKDSAFVSKLKCCVGGETFQVAFVTQAKYNELFKNNQLTDNTFYFITDDPTEENIEANIETLAKEIDATNEIIGNIIEGKKVGNFIIPVKKIIGTNLNISQTTSEGGSFYVNLGDIVLETKKHYLLVGSWDIPSSNGNKTLFYYDLYTEISSYGQYYRPLLIRASMTHDTKIVKTEIYINMTDNSSSRIKVVPLETDEKFSAGNVISIDSIYEIIE